MSLQWTAVATFLYAEVFAVLLLCIPFISPTRWQKIFKSRLVQLVLTYGNTFFVVLIVILVLLLIGRRPYRDAEVPDCQMAMETSLEGREESVVFSHPEMVVIRDLQEWNVSKCIVTDALREIKKYDVSENVDLKNNPVAVEHIHMKLFRAQRNLYIAGFSLLLSFLLRRLVTLISTQATLLASNEAFKRQAEGASDAAKKYMEENEKLKKDLKATGAEVGDFSQANPEEDKKLKAEVHRLKDELETAKKSIQKSENEVHAIKKQSDGLSKEYDRLLGEHAKLQAVMDGPTDKKEE